MLFDSIKENWDVLRDTLKDLYFSGKDDVSDDELKTAVEKSLIGGDLSRRDFEKKLSGFIIGTLANSSNVAVQGFVAVENSIKEEYLKVDRLLLIGIYVPSRENGLRI